MRTIIILGLIITIGGHYYFAGKGMDGAVKYWGLLALYTICAIGYVLVTRF